MFVQLIFTVSYTRMCVHLHYVLKLIQHSNDDTHSFWRISRALILCSWYFMEHHPLSRLSTIALLEHSFMKVTLKWTCECCLFNKLHQCLYHISKVLLIKKTRMFKYVYVHICKPRKNSITVRCFTFYYRALLIYGPEHFTFMKTSPLHV